MINFHGVEKEYWRKLIQKNREALAAEQVKEFR